MLPEAVQRVASGHVLAGCLEVKSDQDPGLVRFGEVLDGFDHLVGSIVAPNTMLKWACRCHDRRFLSRNDRFERKSPQERHHVQRSLPSCGFGEWLDLTGA